MMGRDGESKFDMQLIVMSMTGKATSAWVD